jgi:hypothetical protein
MSTHAVPALHQTLATVKTPLKCCARQVQPAQQVEGDMSHLLRNSRVQQYLGDRDGPNAQL